MSTDQLALRNEVYAAWAEAYTAHRRVRDVPNKNLMLKFEEHGDDLVASSMALALWDTAMEFGNGTGDWARALELVRVTGEQMRTSRRPTGVVAGAVWHVRQTACQAVLTRADEILATSAT